MFIKSSGIDPQFKKSQVIFQPFSMILRYRRFFNCPCSIVNNCLMIIKSNGAIQKQSRNSEDYAKSTVICKNNGKKEASLQKWIWSALIALWLFLVFPRQLFSFIYDAGGFQSPPDHREQYFLSEIVLNQIRADQIHFWRFASFFPLFLQIIVDLA